MIREKQFENRLDSALNYRLPGQNRITAYFLGYANSCGDITPTPTFTATPTPPTYHLYAVHDADVRDSQFFTIDTVQQHGSCARAAARQCRY